MGVNNEITWKSSTLRSWLNGFKGTENLAGRDYTIGNFKDTAFTADEQTHIRKTVHNTPDHVTGKPVGGETEDTIFVLSTDEYLSSIYEGYFVGIVPTRYAKVKKNVHVLPEGCSGMDCTSFWWLRSPSLYSEEDEANHQYKMSGVNHLGRIDDGSYTVDNWYIGVRPALWLKHGD